MKIDKTDIPEKATAEQITGWTTGGHANLPERFEYTCKQSQSVGSEPRPANNPAFSVRS